MSNAPRALTLREIAQEIATIDLTPVSVGPFSLEEVEADNLKNVQATFEELASTNIDCLTGAMRETINRKTSEMLPLFRELVAFDPSRYGQTGSPKAALAKMAGQIMRNYAEAAPHLFMGIAYARATKSQAKEFLEVMRNRSAELIRQIEREAEPALNLINSSKGQFEKLISDAQLALAAAQRASAEAGVSGQAELFKEEAESEKAAAKRWLVTTFLAILVGIGIIITVLLDADLLEMAQRSGSSAMVLYTVPKLILVALIFSAVVLCSRNYHACRHNYTVNRHRHTALATFQAFVRGANDQAAKDAILRQAAACAFSPQASGYLKDESTQGQNDRLIEILQQNPRS